jgi:hypothetical protein
MIETLLMIGMDTLDGIEVERKLSLYIWKFWSMPYLHHQYLHQHVPGRCFAGIAINDMNLVGVVAAWNG